MEKSSGRPGKRRGETGRPDRRTDAGVAGRGPGGEAPAPWGGQALRWAAAGCFLLLVAAYANHFRNPFHFDDAYVVETNGYIRSLANVPKFFTDARTYTSTPANMQYRPLVSLTLAVDHAVGGGLDPVAFRVSQFLMMAGLGVLLFLFYRRTMDQCRPAPENPWLALFLATLFCVHVLNTETLNIVQVRSELLSTAGIMGAFVVYGFGTRPRRWLSLLPVAVGALAKAPAVLFAPLLLARDFLLPPRPQGTGGLTARLRRSALVAAPAFGAGVLLYLFIEKVMPPPSMSYGGPGRLEYALTQAWAWVHYLRLYVLPIGLSADTDLAPITEWYDTRVIAGLAVVAAILWTAWRTAGSEEAWPVSFGLAWFVVALLPASSILPLAETMNEHRSFVANIGLGLAVGWGARLGWRRVTADWPARSRARWLVPAAAGVLVLLAHAVGTHVRNRAWSSREALWADVTAKSPQNGRAWMNYGVQLMGRGALVEAKAMFERALPLSPNYPTLHVNLGVVNGALGDGAAAEANFRRALALGPGQPSSYFYYARWLIEQGRAPEALPLLERNLQAAPADEPARAMLVELLAARGAPAATARAAQDYLALFPGNARVRALGSGAFPAAAGSSDPAALLREAQQAVQRKALVAAAIDFRAALSVSPDSAEALRGLGGSLAGLGFQDEAVAVLERLVALRPDLQDARVQLQQARQGRKAP